MSTHFNLKFLGRSFLVLSVMVGAAAPALAVTTFTGGTSTAWNDGTNWDAGVPNGNDAVIGDGKTAVVTQAEIDANAFGTLTLGVNSTLQLAAGSKAGLPTGKTVNFSDGSYLQLTAGNINRVANYNVLAGAMASFKPGTTSDSILQYSAGPPEAGKLTGASDSIFNIRVAVAPLRLRWNASGFLGTVNYISDNGSAQQVELANFGANNTHFGPGTTVIDNNVRVTYLASNRISDTGTVKLVGGAGGGSNIKFAMGVDRSDTIGNLIIDSPVASSGAYMQMRNGFLTVAGTGAVTFQGTAGTVEIDNTLVGFNAGLSAINADIIFNGTGNWAITGDGQLRVNGATVTTNANATISNLLDGTTSFTKNGAGTLTLNGDMSFYTGTINVTAGTLAAKDSIKGISVSTNAALTIGTATSAADTLTLGTSGLTLANNSAINWQYMGATTAGTDYDTIVQATGSLDLTGKSITINGTALAGYEAQIGDTFTLFNGAVTGFDAGNFTLNLPTLSEGQWQISASSLLLSVVPIPEPSAAALLLTGFGVLSISFRRRRK